LPFMIIDVLFFHSNQRFVSSGASFAHLSAGTTGRCNTPRLYPAHPACAKLRQAHRVIIVSPSSG
jgi:hypothetical protein